MVWRRSRSLTHCSPEPRGLPTHGSPGPPAFHTACAETGAARAEPAQGTARVREGQKGCGSCVQRGRGQCVLAQMHSVNHTARLGHLTPRRLYLVRSVKRRDWRGADAVSGTEHCSQARGHGTARSVGVFQNKYQNVTRRQTGSARRAGGRGTQSRKAPGRGCHRVAAKPCTAVRGPQGSWWGAGTTDGQGVPETASQSGGGSQHPSPRRGYRRPRSQHTPPRREQEQAHSGRGARRGLASAVLVTEALDGAVGGACRRVAQTAAACVGVLGWFRPMVEHSQPAKSTSSASDLLMKA